MRGQVSLEFLLITAAFLGLLGLFASVLATVFENGQFAQTAASGQRLADEIANQSKWILAGAENSQRTISLRGFSRLELTASQTELVIRVFSPNNEREKTFQRTLALIAAPVQLNLENANELVLQKQQNRLIIHYK